MLSTTSSLFASIDAVTTFDDILVFLGNEILYNKFVISSILFDICVLLLLSSSLHLYAFSLRAPPFFLVRRVWDLSETPLHDADVLQQFLGLRLLRSNVHHGGACGILVQAASCRGNKPGEIERIVDTQVQSGTLRRTSVTLLEMLDLRRARR